MAQARSRTLSVRQLCLFIANIIVLAASTTGAPVPVSAAAVSSARYQEAPSVTVTALPTAQVPATELPATTPTALPMPTTEAPATVVPIATNASAAISQSTQSTATVVPTARPTRRPTARPTQQSTATAVVVDASLLITATATATATSIPALTAAETAPQISSVAWGRPAQLSNAGQFGGAPAMAIDSAGNIHVLWSERDPNEKLTAEGQVFFYSRWDGNTWSAPRDVLTSLDEDGVESPNMVVSPDGFLHVVWGTGGIDSRLMYARAPACCADKPGNWSKPIVLGLPVNLSTSLAVDSKGRLHTAFASLDGAIHYYRSDDGGVTWQVRTPLQGKIRTGGEYPIYPSIAIDSHDHVHLAWTIYPWPGAFVLYNHSDDGGDTWGKPQVIDRGDNNLFTSTRDYGPVFISVQTTVDPQGKERIHLVWDGPPTVERNYIYSEDGGQTWSQRYLIFPEITRVGRAGFNRIMVDSGGTYHAVAFNWHSIWQGNGWLPASIRFNESGSAEQMSAQMALGNQIVVVYQDKSAERIPSVWVVFGQTSSPPSLPKPLPKIEPANLLAQPLPPGLKPTAQPLPGANESKPAALPTIPPINRQLTQPYTNPFETSMLGVLPIAVLLLIVALVVGARGRGR